MRFSAASSDPKPWVAPPDRAGTRCCVGGCACACARGPLVCSHRVRRPWRGERHHAVLLQGSGMGAHTVVLTVPSWLSQQRSGAACADGRACCVGHLCGGPPSWCGHAVVGCACQCAGVVDQQAGPCFFMLARVLGGLVDPPRLQSSVRVFVEGLSATVWDGQRPSLGLEGALDDEGRSPRTRWMLRRTEGDQEGGAGHVDGRLCVSCDLPV